MTETPHTSPQPPRPAIPPLLLAGLAAAILLDTMVQILWKRSTLSLPADFAIHPLAGLWSLARRGDVIVVGLLIGAQMVNWLKVLDRADVSYALPITALSYVSVAGASYLFLHEGLSPARMAGIALILLGVFFISRSQPVTAKVGEGGQP